MNDIFFFFCGLFYVNNLVINNNIKCIVVIVLIELSIDVNINFVVLFVLL